MSKFGEEVEGYNIPVLNEREIRASAGIIFLMMFMALLIAILKENFILIKYGITMFLSDMLIRVFINPKFSPFLIIGRLIVRNQRPEYVGAQQKKFAWIIGVILSGTIFIFMVLGNTYSPITGIACLICLIFLFCETAFGICVGCKIYNLFYKEKAQHCPGEVCDLKVKEDIQKTSKIQLLALFSFIITIILIGILFNDGFTKKPYDLFGINKTAQAG